MFLNFECVPHVSDFLNSQLKIGLFMDIDSTIFCHQPCLVNHSDVQGRKYISFDYVVPEETPLLYEMLIYPDGDSYIAGSPAGSCMIEHRMNGEILFHELFNGAPYYGAMTFDNLILYKGVSALWSLELY